MKIIASILCVLTTFATLAPMKHVSYVASYLEIIKQSNRFDIVRAQECFKLDECKEVRKDWSKNKDKVTADHWNILKEREALIHGDILIAELEALTKIKTSKMKLYQKKEHDKSLALAQFKITHFLQTSLREIMSKKLDTELSKMKKKLRKLNISIPRKLR